MSIQDEGQNDVYCLDFNKDGTELAVGGRDIAIKIYDENTKALKTRLAAVAGLTMGHSNRVFSVRYTEDPNVLVSGGWDNTVHFWDLRDSHSIGYILGPHICGDSIDVRGNTILTGSYSNKNVLQLWSIPERKLLANIPWEPGAANELEQGYLYTAQFDKSTGGGDSYIAAGGSGNEMRFFRNNKDYELLGKISFNRAVTSIDFAHTHNMFAISCGDGFTRLYSFEDSHKSY